MATWKLILKYFFKKLGVFVRHWIFDLDNTLINSFPLYSSILNEVTEQYGVQLSIAD